MTDTAPGRITTAREWPGRWETITRALTGEDGSE